MVRGGPVGLSERDGRSLRSVQGGAQVRQPAGMSSLVDAADSRRNARCFLFAVLVSGFGSTAMVLVAGVWAKELTGSDAAAGWMSVAVWAPVVAAPWLGGTADRLGPRRVLVGGNLLIAMALLSLMLVEHGGGVWLLGAVMALYGLSFVLLDVAEGGVLPRMVSDAVLADVNGRRMALQEGAKIVAPAAGAALYVVIGGGGVAILDAATFGVAAVAIASMRPLREQTRTASGSQPHVGGTTAVRLLRARPGVWRSVMLGAAAMLAAGTAGPVMFAVVEEGLGRPAAFLGALAAVQGAGSVVAGLAVGPLLRRWTGSTIIAAGTLLVAVGLVARSSGSVAVVALGSACVGAGLPAVIATSITQAQRAADSSSTASMVGAVTTTLFVPHALGLVLGSLLVERLDHRVVLIVLGAGLLSGASALRVRLRDGTGAGRTSQTWGGRLP